MKKCQDALNRVFREILNKPTMKMVGDTTRE
jgi:hypothetical protein